MVNHTDDWWSPTEPFWFEDPPQNKIEYRIMRAKKVVSDSSPGFTIQWVKYKTFSTSRARDNELSKLNKENPKWRLKATQGNPYLERLGFPNGLPAEGINK